MKNLAMIGLVGDFDESVLAHKAIPLALERAASLAEANVGFVWVDTEEIVSTERIGQFDGLWCVPASPYRNMDGALLAIRHARENGIPFLGTCGGFQHAIIEYARNVLGWAAADHAETAPESSMAVISPLECSLVEVSGQIQLAPGSLISFVYETAEITEGYHCRFGLNPRFQAALVSGPLRATAHDKSGEVRAVELDNHPFFVATLFQPERAALRGEQAPLVDAFVSACLT